MERKSNWLILLSLVFLLGACSQKSVDSEKVEDTTIQTSSSSSEKKVNPEEKYASVLKKYVQLSSSGYDALKSVVAGAGPEETMIMNFIADGSKNGRTQQYTFYDIDNDQSEELIIGKPDFISAIYTLKGDSPVFVKGAGMPSAGAMRSSLSVYGDGTIMYVAGSSTDPNWDASSYQIKAGEVVELTKIEFTQGQGDDVVKLLNITSEKVDFKKLSWNELKSTPQKEETSTKTTSGNSSKADVDSIMKGDTSSLDGTWTNSKGETITIKDGKITTSGLEQVTFEVKTFVRKKEFPMLKLNTGEYNPLGDPALVLIPADDSIYPDKDMSDSTKDRLVYAYAVAQTQDVSADYYFYR